MHIGISLGINAMQRRGGSAVPATAIHDRAGNAILDRAGNYILVRAA
jgi:hypothetical protein